MRKQSGPLLLIALAALLACKKLRPEPAAGAACDSEGESTCQGLDTELVCLGKLWRPYPCRGPGGCAKTKSGATCDMSNNLPGDTCPKAREGKSHCSGDSKSLLACMAGQIRTTSCEGPKGCKQHDGQATCDESVARVGSACKDEGSAACSSDQKNYLVCKNGQRVLEAPCRGKKGCFIDAQRKHRVTCDYSLAYPGDSCHEDQSGENVGWACAVHANRTLKCKNGKFKYANEYYGCICKIHYYDKSNQPPFYISCD